MIQQEIINPSNPPTKWTTIGKHTREIIETENATNIIVL